MARQASYKKVLLTAREEAQQRLGPAYKFRGAIVDRDDDVAKLAGSALVPRREQTEEEMDDDFLGSTFNRIYADNRTLAEMLSDRGASIEGSSTRAMTGPDGKPLDILNKGDDVNIKIDPKSEEGINNFYSALLMSESSNNSQARRTNKDGKEFGGEGQFGLERLQDYMRETGAAFDMDAFVDDPQLQKKVGAWHINSIDKEIAKIKNIPANLSNQNGLRAVAHLGGIEGMKEFIRTNGKYNKRDELGTRLMSYYKKFSSGTEA